jgi:hypothetical protein
MSYPLILEPHGKTIAIRLTSIDDKKYFVSNMKKHKGRWNSRMKGGMGWTFPDEKKGEVELFMKSTNNGRTILEKKQAHSDSGKVYHRADTDDSSPNSDGPGESPKEITRPVFPPGSKSSPLKTGEETRHELKIQSMPLAVDPQPVKADAVPTTENSREEITKKPGIIDDVIDKLVYSLDKATTKDDDYNSSDDSDYKSGQSSDSSSDSSSESSDSSTSESHKHKRHNTTKHGRSNAQIDIFNGRSDRELEPLAIESESARRLRKAVAASKKDSKYKQLDMSAKKYKKKFVESSSDYSSSSEESEESEDDFPDPYAKAPKNRLDQDSQLRKLIEQNSALKRKEVASEIKLKKLEASMASLKSHRQLSRKSSPVKDERRRHRPGHKDEGKVSERKRSGKRR